MRELLEQGLAHAVLNETPVLETPALQTAWQRAHTALKTIEARVDAGDVSEAIANIVDLEGLAYAVESFLPAERIDEDLLSEQWAAAQQALTDLEALVPA